MEAKEYIEFFKNCDSCWANLGDPVKEKSLDKNDIKELIQLLYRLIKAGLPDYAAPETRCPLCKRYVEPGFLFRIVTKKQIKNTVCPKCRKDTKDIPYNGHTNS